MKYLIIFYLDNEMSPNHWLHTENKTIDYLDNERSPNHWLHIDNEISFNNFLHCHWQGNVTKLLTIKRLNIIDCIHNESSPNHWLHIDNERSPNHWLHIDNKTFPNHFLHRQWNVPKSLTIHRQLNVSELLNTCINYTTELFKSALLKISLTWLSWVNI